MLKVIAKQTQHVLYQIHNSEKNMNSNIILGFGYANSCEVVFTHGWQLLQSLKCINNHNIWRHSSLTFWSEKCSIKRLAVKLNLNVFQSGTPHLRSQRRHWWMKAQSPRSISSLVIILPQTLETLLKGLKSVTLQLIVQLISHTSCSQDHWNMLVSILALTIHFSRSFS